MVTLQKETKMKLFVPVIILSVLMMGSLNFAAGDPHIVNAYKELLAYKDKHESLKRGSYYLRSKDVDFLKKCHWGTTAIAALGSCALSLWGLKFIRNTHLHSASVVLATSLAAFLSQIPWINLWVFHFATADKVKRRTLVDGYETIQKIKHLKSEQVKLLEDMRTELYVGKKREDLKADCIFNLLACAKNSSGCLEVPADIQQQKIDEDAIKPLVVGFNPMCDASGVLLKNESDVCPLRSILESIETYSRNIHRFRSGVKDQCRKWIVPAAAVVGYCGAYTYLNGMCYGWKKTGLCLASTVASGLASVFIFDKFYSLFLKDRLHNNDTRQDRQHAADEINRLTTDEKKHVKDIYTFGKKYGYIPKIKRHCLGGQRHRAESQYALDLLP